MDIWGDKSAPYLQMLYVCILVGCTISAQMVKPFLANGVETESTRNNILKNIFAVMNNDNSTPVSENDTETFESVTNFETQISYGFLIIGFVVLLGAALHFCHLGLSGCDRKHIHLQKKTSGKLESPDVKQSNHPGGSRVFQLFVIC